MHPDEAERRKKIYEGIENLAESGSSEEIKALADAILVLRESVNEVSKKAEAGIHSEDRYT